MTELKESLVSDRQPGTSLLIIFLIVFFGFPFIGQYVGMLVGSFFYEGDLLSELQKSKPDASVFFPAMVAQGVGAFVGLIVIPISYLWYFEHKRLAPFFQREKDVTKIFSIIPILGVCFMIAISPISEWNMNFQFPDFLKEFGTWARATEDKFAELTRLMTNYNSTAEFILGLVVIAVLPGVGEELVFRGLIQNEIHRSSKNIHIAIWTSAFLFSAIHLQFFGFIPRMLLGALFGYLYHWSRNLLVPMVAHFFHNGFTLTMIHLYNQGSTPINLDKEESAPLYLVALSAGVTFVLLYIFRKHYTSTEQLKA